MVRTYVVVPFLSREPRYLPANSQWAWNIQESSSVRRITQTLPQRAAKRMSDEKKDPTQDWEERVLVVRQHYEDKGYRVHSGLQFGCELVLYADDPSKVHSDFCVHVVPEGKLIVD